MAWLVQVQCGREHTRRTKSQKITINQHIMKRLTLKQATYEEPRFEIVHLVAETSLMLSGSGIEEGEYEEDEW